MSAAYSAFAPASVANFGPGFDVFGVALEGIGDTVTARESTEDGVQIVQIRGCGGGLPIAASRNTAGLAVQKIRELLGPGTPGIDLLIDKQLPVGSGLGGSAASAVAAAVAANAVLGRPFKKTDLLPACRAGEVAAAGVDHADNVACSLLGGAVIVDAESGRTCGLPIPANLWLAVLHPFFQLLTSDARKALPTSVTLDMAVANLANVARLVHAFHSSDVQLIGEAMQDSLAEPARLPLIPGGSLLREAAKNEKALGFSICGSGPSVVAVADSRAVASRAGEAMKTVLANEGVGSELWVVRPSQHGAHLLPPNETVDF